MRIVVRAPDAASASVAQAQLAAAGIDAEALIGGACAKDAADLQISTSATPAVTSALAHLSAHAIASAPSPLGSFDGAIALDASPTMLRAQIEAWKRIAIARDECMRRALTATALGLAVPSHPLAPPPHALFVGPANPAFLAIERALSDVGGALNGTLSSSSGFDHLHDQTFDAVILNAADDPQSALSFCAALRRNSTLFDLPTMVLVAPGEQAVTDAAVERGACAILEASAPQDAPIAWLLETVRRERLRRSAERELRALRDLMGDPRTGLWRYEAFARHLELMKSQHQANSRPLSMTALRILPAHGANAPPAEVWRNTCLEVANLAGRLAREADCVSAIAPDQLLLALPMATIEDARRAAERIAAVVECTTFAAGGTYPSPLVVEQSAVSLGPGETGAALIARALRPFALAA